MSKVGIEKRMLNVWFWLSPTISRPTPKLNHNALYEGDTLNPRQPPIQIRDEVLDALQADGEADDVGAGAGGD